MDEKRRDGVSVAGFCQSCAKIHATRPLDWTCEGITMADIKTPSVPAVERALSIMELLAFVRHGLTLPELSRRLELPKSSAHCLLVTLERRGYLHRNEQTNRYLFGRKLFGLANTALTGLKLREQAAPLLRALMRETRLTVHMAILEQGEAVLVEKIEPPGLMRLATWVGKRMDLHATAVGKALLAYLPDEDIERLIRDHGLPRYNDNTITSARKLKEEIARTRAAGHAVEDQEGEIGFRCIGAPVFDHTGSVAAAISVAGTTAQITGENFASLVEVVKHTAAGLSGVLGYNPGALEQAGPGCVEAVAARSHAAPA
jgi:DNA-binding IclR family transcriptional regulator